MSLLHKVFDNTAVVKITLPKESFDLEYVNNLFSRDTLYRLYRRGILPAVSVDKDVNIYFLGIPLVIYNGNEFMVLRRHQERFTSLLYDILGIELDVEEENPTRIYPDIGVVEEEEELSYLEYNVSFRKAHFFYTLSKGIYRRIREGKPMEFRTATLYYNGDYKILAYFLDPDVEFSEGRMYRYLYIVELDVDESYREGYIYRPKEEVKIKITLENGEEPFIDDFGREVKRIEEIPDEAKDIIFQRLMDYRYVYHGKFGKLRASKLYKVKIKDDPMPYFYSFSSSKPRVYYAERLPNILSNRMLHVRQG